VALPVFTVGQVLTAADVNQYLVNTIAARKTANESVTSSTTLQDDDHLNVTVAANCTYEFTCMLKFDGALAGDLKYQFVGPSGATLTAAVLQIVTGGTVTTEDQLTSMIISSTLTAGAFTGGGSLLIHGIVVVSSTAGTFKLQWAQDTSNGTATRILQDSFFVLRQIL